MERDHYISLIYKNLKAEILPGEQAELDSWLQASAENRTLAERVKSDWEASQNYAPQIDIDAEAEFAKLQQRVQAHRARQEVPGKVIAMQPRRQWIAWVASVAAVLVMVLGGWWLFSEVLRTGEMMALQTGPGETKQVTLSDGTEVWLNENSQLEYPAQFARNQRVTKLQGEGYFAVAKNEAAPFSVETPVAMVTVLGTEFNLKTDPGKQEVNLTVDEGRVRLEPNGYSQSIVVNGGEVGYFNGKENQLQILESLDLNATYWKSGTLVFERNLLSFALSEVREKLQVEVSLQDPTLNDCFVTGRFPNATARDVLEHIADSFGMELVEVSEGSFELRGGSCE